MGSKDDTYKELKKLKIKKLKIIKNLSNLENHHLNKRYKKVCL